MAIYYTDVASNQIQGVNFPGQSGQVMMTTQPGVQNNPILEGPGKITATYTWTGNEAQYDIINIAIIPSGAMIDPNGRVSSGVTAPATTLTLAIGDNDQGLATNLPIPNPQTAPNSLTVIQAPTWVSGTTYAAGTIVLDATSTPAYQPYTAVAATSGTTAPHSAATTVWMPNSQRYSTAINCAGASGNVSTTGGTALYAPYLVSEDCWLQALVATIGTPVAGTTSVFRFEIVDNN
jgi:hypothetical protein